MFYFQTGYFKNQPRRQFILRVASVIFAVLLILVLIFKGSLFGGESSAEGVELSYDEAGNLMEDTLVMTDQDPNYDFEHMDESSEVLEDEHFMQ